MFKRRVSPWKARFALFPTRIDYGPGKGKEVWLRVYYVRWRSVLGAQMLDRASKRVD